MNKKLEQDILMMLGDKGTEEQRQSILNEWGDYFTRMDIQQDKQQQEFEGIIMPRLISSDMSLRAPKPPEFN